MLGKILGFIKNRYCSHFLATFSIQKCNLCYSKLTEILIFASFCFSTLQLFWCKTMSELTSFASQKLVKVVFHAQQQLLILWSDILAMKYTPANFIGHLLAKSSMKITFHRSQKCISAIWVGFFKQSMGILWLLYQVLNVIQWFLGLNNWNGPSLPSRLGHVPKTSICTQTGVKSP